MQSVIVSTYNKPQQLRLVLEGLRHQTAREYEVVVADDGSKDETRQLIAGYAAEVPFRVEHVWQEDRGFRAARVRNLGVKAATGDQIVFLDGDCIPFPGFLDAHRRAARSGVILAGDRLFLDQEPSAALTPEEVADGSFVDRIPRSEYRSLRWRAIKNRVYSATRLKQRPKVVTANLSLSRDDFAAVNGLDERFVGWGHEDEDLRRRLVRRGFRVESVYTTAHVCHLWHRQVASFHGKVKYGDNIPYFQRGFYLSKCREGLETIALEDYRISWNEPNSESDIAVAWGSTPRYASAEIKILVCRRGRPNPDGGDRIGRAPADSEAHLHVVLGDEHTSELIARGDDGPPEVHVGESCDPSQPEGRRQLLDALGPIL